MDKIVKTAGAESVTFASTMEPVSRRPRMTGVFRATFTDTPVSSCRQTNTRRTIRRKKRRYTELMRRSRLLRKPCALPPPDKSETMSKRRTAWRLRRIGRYTIRQACGILEAGRNPPTISCRCIRHLSQSAAFFNIIKLLTIHFPIPVRLVIHFKPENGENNSEHPEEINTARQSNAVNTQNKTGVANASPTYSPPYKHPSQRRVPALETMS